MSRIAIEVKNLSKAYQIGQFNTGALAHDLKRWWALKRGKEDPFLTIGETNDRTVKSDSNIVWSLKDINFQIEQGDAVGIIGRNGAGKSTLLKLLSGITSPTTGEIKIKGRIASLLEVGTGFHPELTGRENIFLNGAILGMRKHEIKRKFDEIVDFAGVERYIDTPVKRYSSGMYVRLAFAVAAHLESEILIVDEVLAVGDAEFQKKCLGKMGEISKGEGRTVLFVSHNMASIRNLCNVGIFMNNGNIVSNGDMEIVMNEYVNDNINLASNNLHSIQRKGNGKIRILNITCFNSNNENTTRFFCGDEISFKIQFTAIGIIGVKTRGRIDIGINSNMGERVAWISTSMFYDVLDFSTGTLSFKIGSLALSPGHYSLNIYAEYNEQVADWIENVFPFEIIESDFYGTGRLIPKGQGHLFLPYKISN